MTQAGSTVWLAAMLAVLAILNPCHAVEVVPAAARAPHVAPAEGGILDLAIKDLGNFEYDAERGGNIPADVTQLSGSRIRVTGFMIPANQAENITEFALVPSLLSCCFGKPPQIQHAVMVRCPVGKAVNHFSGEVTVEGRLTVAELKDEGYIFSVFQLEASSVRPAAKK